MLSSESLMQVKIASETGDKRKIFFCKTAFTAKLHVSRKQFSEE
jgi:hypothetical protein